MPRQPLRGQKPHRGRTRLAPRDPCALKSRWPSLVVRRQVYPCGICQTMYDTPVFCRAVQYQRAITDSVSHPPKVKIYCRNRDCTTRPSRKINAFPGSHCQTSKIKHKRSCKKTRRLSTLISPLLYAPLFSFLNHNACADPFPSLPTPLHRNLLRLTDQGRRKQQPTAFYPLRAWRSHVWNWCKRSGRQQLFRPGVSVARLRLPSHPSLQHAHSAPWARRCKERIRGGAGG